ANIALKQLIMLVRSPFYFFFSSRRRHTRFSRDWSSDVCSSDLRAACRGRGGHRAARARPQERAGRLLRRGRWPYRRSGALGRVRSEERRVGKECGGRGGPQQLKHTKKTRTA